MLFGPVKVNLFKNFSDILRAFFWWLHLPQVLHEYDIAYHKYKTHSVSGKSHTISQLICEHEEEIFGKPFEAIKVFHTNPSKDYLAWTVKNPRLTVEDLTPSEALQQLESQELDTYPRACYIFEDWFTNKKTQDPRLVEYWTAGWSLLCLQWLLHGMHLQRFSVQSPEHHGHCNQSSAVLAQPGPSHHCTAINCARHLGIVP